MQVIVLYVYVLQMEINSIKKTARLTKLQVYNEGYSNDSMQLREDNSQYMAGKSENWRMEIFR